MDIEPKPQEKNHYSQKTIDILTNSFSYYVRFACDAHRFQTECDFRRQQQGFISVLEKALNDSLETVPAQKEDLTEIKDVALQDWSRVETIHELYQKRKSIFGIGYNEADLFPKDKKI